MTFFYYYPTITLKQPTKTKPAKHIKYAADGSIILAPVDQRILNLIEKLKEDGHIRFDSDFARDIGIGKQELPSIARGRRRFTIPDIEAICEKYGVNPSWLFGYSNNVYRQFK